MIKAYTGARTAVDPDARRKELAQIHLGVKALQWSDADYRAILLAKTGKASSADLDSAQRKRFIEHPFIQSGP